MTSLLLALAAFACAATGRFEPVKVLRAHGLDPAKLTLTVDVQPGPKGVVHVRGDYAGEPLKGVKAFQGGIFGTEPAGHWDVAAGALPENLRGKGLGTTLYLIAAKLVADAGGTMTSRDVFREESASRVWDGLVASGVAESSVVGGVRTDSIVLRPAKLAAATAPAMALLRAHDPERVLRARGVDPDSLSFTVASAPEIRTGRMPATFSDRFSITARRGDAVVGHIAARRGAMNSSLWTVQSVHVASELEGKGLGAALHLAAARLLADERGGALASLRTARSAASSRAWARLRAAGLVREKPTTQGPLDVLTTDRGLLEPATEKARAFVAARLAR